MPHKRLLCGNGIFLCDVGEEEEEKQKSAEKKKVKTLLCVFYTT